MIECVLLVYSPTWMALVATTLYEPTPATLELTA